MTQSTPQFTVSPPDVPLEGVGVERKHTPGPWYVRTDGEQSCGFEMDGPLVEVVSADGTVICCNERYYPTSLDPKNAQLIAAAPDMLDALIEIVNKYGNGWGGQIAAKAIAKATTPQE